MVMVPLAYPENSREGMEVGSREEAVSALLEDRGEPVEDSEDSRSKVDRGDDRSVDTDTDRDAVSERARDSDSDSS